MPVEKGHLLINDIGLLRGYALFDYCRTYGGKPFMRELYLQRFQHSAALMGIPFPFESAVLWQIMDKLHRLTGMQDIAFRLLLTGGYTTDGVTPSNTPNLLIITEDIPDVAPEKFTMGIHVITDEYLRELPEIKSTNYVRLIMLRHRIKAAGAADVLFCKDGWVSELSRSNLFLFHGNTLVTPNANILKGITRYAILQLAKGIFKVEERPVAVEELWQASEVFTTGTTKRVMPITVINGQPIADGKPGHNTLKLLAQFNELTASLSVAI
ncbi:MAG: aminotransferase class IV [Cytophagales bacterium]|nr:aminotransferase class IV [Bernardetiaceae bacterium]MDW8206071.1 aminotransferase class IV [Cytophagales bacterium]